MMAMPEHALGIEPTKPEVAALLACEALILESYARADAGQRAQGADLFRTDGQLRLGEQHVRGRDAIRATLSARDIPGRRTQHIVTNLRGRLLDDEQMLVTYVVTLYELSDPDAAPCNPRALCSVQDVLVRQSGGWRIQDRALVLLAGEG